jgi:sterol desaturase/sphingolipid hydroxylase (fatty acid hydroxylase superfamily)
MHVFDIEHLNRIAAVATFVLMWTWESLAPFQTFASGRLIHSARNLALGGINALAAATVFAGVTVATCLYSQTEGIGILYWVPLPPFAAAVLAFIALDVWTYAWHRANHVIPFLWRFHRTHHSDHLMDVSTAVRFHVGEIAISSLVRLPLILLIGLPLGALLIYDTLLRIATQFHHSNVNLPGRSDALLRLLIVSPDMHKIHHSQERADMDSNYASVLSVWDRLFRTYRVCIDKSQLRYGVPGLSDNTPQRLWDLLRTPLSPLRRND